MNDTMQRLLQLRRETESLWDLAVETASPDRREDCKRDRDDALQQWDFALECYESSAVASALEHLRAAKFAARQWGDDCPECAAIILIENED